MARRAMVVPILLIIVAFLLGACAAAPQPATPTAAPAVATPASAPTATSAPAKPAAAPTAAPAAAPTTAPAAATTTAAKTPSGAPVKIAASMDWSGPFGMVGPAMVDPAIQYLEDTVNSSGGVLGRPLKVLKADSAGETAKALAADKKAVEEDKASVILFGGYSTATQQAAADVAEKNKILVISFTPLKQANGAPYTVQTTPFPAQSEIATAVAKGVVSVVKPQTAAYLVIDMDILKNGINIAKGTMEAAGVKTANALTVPADTEDFTPSLTTIKAAKPDVLFVGAGLPQYFGITKQIAALGGLGNTQLVFPTDFAASDASFGASPGSEGAIAPFAWRADDPYPASVAFRDAYTKKMGKAPDGNIVLFYDGLQLAVKAIEKAGTDDPQKVLASAQSGVIEFDSPVGLLRLDKLQLASMPIKLGRWSGGKMTEIWQGKGDR